MSSGRQRVPDDYQPDIRELVIALAVGLAGLVLAYVGWSSRGAG
jgi:hypothetical protein